LTVKEERDAGLEVSSDVIDQQIGLPGVGAARRKSCSGQGGRKELPGFERFKHAGLLKTGTARKVRRPVAHVELLR
jgi:hypothetical protein